MLSTSIGVVSDILTLGLARRIAAPTEVISWISLSSSVATVGDAAAHWVSGSKANLEELDLDASQGELYATLALVNDL